MRHLLIVCLILSMAALLLAGCGNDSSPTGTPAFDRDAGPVWQPLKKQPGDGTADWRTKTADDLWYAVATKRVRAGQTVTVSGSRYSLAFDAASLAERLTVVLNERSPIWVETRIDPDGAALAGTALLTIDYAGTANDPDSPLFHGGDPAVFQLDEASGAWVKLDGAVVDPAARTIAVEIDRFARCAMWDVVRWSSLVTF